MGAPVVYSIKQAYISEKDSQIDFTVLPKYFFCCASCDICHDSKPKQQNTAKVALNICLQMNFLGFSVIFCWFVQNISCISPNYIRI